MSGLCRQENIHYNKSKDLYHQAQKLKLFGVITDYRMVPSVLIWFFFIDLLYFNQRQRLLQFSSEKFLSTFTTYKVCHASITHCILLHTYLFLIHMQILEGYISYKSRSLISFFKEKTCMYCMHTDMIPTCYYSKSSIRVRDCLNFFLNCTV